MVTIVGEAIVSKVIEKLVDVGFNYAADQYFARRRRMKDEVERLDDALPHIQAVVEAAESGRLETTGALNKWLWQLKDAVHMADDVLDDVEYLRIEKQVEMNAAGTRPDGSRVRGFIADSKRKVSHFSKRAFKSDPTLDRLRGAVKRLDEVAARAKDFISILQLRQQQQQQQTQIAAGSNRETGPILNDSSVLGREKERKEVLRWLTPDAAADDHEESISLFSIVGIGGVGKTTLLQLVWEDDTLKSYFDIKLWACVSTPFDVNKIMGDILQRKDGALSTLQEALKAHVSSKKFLLVLDDAWNDDDRTSWEKLFAPLRSGLKGSKILLSTRSKKVAEKAAEAWGGSVEEPMRLEPLRSDDFLSLFNRCAFAGVNPREYGKLELLGEQIAGRLGGLPLAAKMTGALLRSKLDEDHWKNILQSSQISDQAAEQRDGVVPVLMLSYLHLPRHLRPCFAFCSTFPQDHMFTKYNLVLMWMALGFVQQSPQNSAVTPEDKGGSYFDDLTKLSFFERRGLFLTKISEVEEHFVMHDLLHDLAHRVSQDECFRFVGDMSINQIPNTVRHLYFKSWDTGLLKDMVHMDRWKNLHTLILEFHGYIDEHAVTFGQVFESLESIRVLSITVRGMEVPPDEMGKLRHLRYLSIGHIFTRLPSSICKLYHLQVLDCEERNVVVDPDTPALCLKNLINLRHLLLRGEKIDGIGTLTSLQRLFFKAGACKLSELKDLRELQVLSIVSPKNDRHGEEVSLLPLDGKERLHRLDLEWSDDCSDAVEEHEEVLDRLHPPDGLKQLKITRYRGARSPYWMEQGSLKNLEEIGLSFSRAWERLPSLGKLHYLNKLSLSGLTALKQISFEGGFQRLKILEICSCEQWEEWSGLEAAETAAPCWPLLEHLYIGGCPKLKALPPLPLGLRLLELRGVGLSDCPTFCLATPSSSSPSLRYMLIKGCVKLTSVAGLLRHRLTSLKELWIRHCEALVDLHAEEGFRHLHSIKLLEIDHCPKLKMATDAVALADCFPLSLLRRLGLSHCGELDGLFPALLMRAPTSLSSLSLGGSNRITSFPSEEACRRRLTSLKELDLREWGELTSVEGLKALSHLDRLSIHGCPKLVQAAAATTSSASNKGEEEERKFTLTVDSLEIDDPLLLHIEPLRRYTSVRDLTIGDCRNLEREGDITSWLLRNKTSLLTITLYSYTVKLLPCSLREHSSLRYLYIYEAYELQSLPQMPSSLLTLWIEDCNETLYERCRRDKGADWPNIKHIPDVRIKVLPDGIEAHAKKTSSDQSGSPSSETSPRSLKAHPKFVFVSYKLA